MNGVVCTVCSQTPLKVVGRGAFDRDTFWCHNCGSLIDGLTTNTSIAWQFVKIIHPEPFYKCSCGRIGPLTNYCPKCGAA